MNMPPLTVLEWMTNFSVGFNTPFIICLPRELKKGSRTMNVKLRLRMGSGFPPTAIETAVDPAAVATHIPELF